MNKEEMNNKIEDLKVKMNKLNDEIKDASDTLQLKGMYAKDELNEKSDEAKSNLEAAKENYRIYSERAKSKLSSKLLEAQLNIEVAKENISAKKEIHDREELEKYINDTLEYATNCVALAVYAADEAKLAFLEAAEAQAEHDEKYGEDENK